MADEIVPERRFAEEIGLLLSGMGMTPAYGKLLGWLLLCDPPAQSYAQLGEALGMSKGSVSTGMRQLERTGLVRRVAAPGSRGHVYEMTPNAFIEISERARALYGTVREAMERGLALIGDESSPRADRLRTTRDFYWYVEAEVPKLIERFKTDYLSKEGGQEGG